MSALLSGSSMTCGFAISRPDHRVVRGGVVKLTRFCGVADTVSAEEIRAFQVELLTEGVVEPVQSGGVGARFFFADAGRPGVVEMLPYGKKPRRLPGC